MNVVFVCEFGSKKSLVAAEYFNREAAARGLPMRAVSRGIRPDLEIPQRFMDLFRSENIDIGSTAPQQLTQRDLDEAGLVVSFASHDEGLPGTTTDILFWTDAPAFSDDFEGARNHILERVRELVRRERL